jgi:hypothetical protein
MSLPNGLPALLVLSKRRKFAWQPLDVEGQLVNRDDWDFDVVRKDGVPDSRWKCHGCLHYDVA